MKVAAASAAGVITVAVLVWAGMPGPRDGAESAEDVPTLEAAPEPTQPTAAPSAKPPAPPVAAPAPTAAPPPPAPPVAVMEAPEMPPPVEPPASARHDGPLGAHADYSIASQFLEDAREQKDRLVAEELPQWRISDAEGAQAVHAITVAMNQAKDATMRMLDGAMGPDEWRKRIEQVDGELKASITRDLGKRHLPGLERLKARLFRTTPAPLRNLYLAP